jgi:hypothetical protein
VRRALELTGGQLRRAADLLGIHRNTLRRKLRDWGLGTDSESRKRKNDTGTSPTDSLGNSATDSLQS